MQVDSFERYSRNCESFSRDEVEQIHQKRVCIIGCGGLGGFVCQSLLRFGVLHMTIVDGDVFTTSNLNRQLFANEETLGQKKAIVCQRELKKINHNAQIIAIDQMLDEKNSIEILQNHDLVIDCLDSIAARHILNQACFSLNIPFVHGAVGGFYGQISSVFPGDKTIQILYANTPENSGIEKTLGTPSFAPQLVAAIQCSEALKILCNRGDILKNAVLYIDLLRNSFETLHFS